MNRSTIKPPMTITVMASTEAAGSGGETAQQEGRAVHLQRADGKTSSSVASQRLGTTLGLERLLDDIRSPLHHLACPLGQLVWQQVSDPHEPGAAISFWEDLRGSVVVSVWPTDDRPTETTGILVEVHQLLADDRAAREGDDPVVSVQLSVDHEARHEALM
jgi:hypothetical protein